MNLCLYGSVIICFLSLVVFEFFNFQTNTLLFMDSFRTFAANVRNGIL